MGTNNNDPLGFIMGMLGLGDIFKQAKVVEMTEESECVD